MLWGVNRGKWKGRQLPGVGPRTPLAWAASALPLSHNSWITTNPHNPLYVCNVDTMHAYIETLVTCTKCRHVFFELVSDHISPLVDNICHPIPRTHDNLIFPTALKYNVGLWVRVHEQSHDVMMFDHSFTTYSQWHRAFQLQRDCGQPEVPTASSRPSASWLILHKRRGRRDKESSHNHHL